MRELIQSCPSCGAAVAVSDETAVARCDACFEAYLRDIDISFLEAHAEFGCLSRQVVAETCLRGLVLETPNHRKILGVAIFEQFILAASDMLALYHAVRERRATPIVRSFLEFRLGGDSTARFFGELTEIGDSDLLAGLGLPHPDEIRERYGLRGRDARSLELALHSVLRGLHRVGDGGTTTERALLAASAGFDGATALIAGGSWAGQELRPGEAAAIALDASRRRIAVQPVATDEATMQEVVDAIDACTTASRDLIYALLVLHDMAADDNSIDRL